MKRPSARGWPITVDQIGANIEMRKKREVLRDVADPAQAWRKVHSRAASESTVSPSCDRSGNWSAQAGDQIEQRSFSRAGWPENAGDRTIESCIDLQSEAGQRKPDL